MPAEFGLRSVPRRLLPAGGPALVLVLVLVLMLALVLAGCGSAAVPGAAPSPASSPAPSWPAGSAMPATATPRPAASRPAPPPTSPPRGSATAARPARHPLVVLDPGHNGGNIEHLAQVNRLVDAGHGRRKRCNEIGAATAGGYAEHAFTWDLAVRLRALLVARGVDVRLTRPNDTGFGPCVDARARFANAVEAEAVVSLHADGGPASGRGFHVIEAARPAGDKTASNRLALAVRASMLAGSGLRYATYAAGGDGLDVRDDLAGLTLSRRPSVMVEAGNMRNPADATLQSSPADRQRIAAALAAGILSYLGP